MTDYQRGYRDACAYIAKQLRSAAADLHKRAERALAPELRGHYRAAAIGLDAHAGAVEKLGESAPEEK